MTERQCDHPNLTTRQRTVLDCITDHVRNHGYPPTVRYLAGATGLTSTSSVAHHLRTLQDRGYLRRVHGQPRAIQIVEPDGEDDEPGDVTRCWLCRGLGGLVIHAGASQGRRTPVWAAHNIRTARRLCQPCPACDTATCTGD